MRTLRIATGLVLLSAIALPGVVSANSCCDGIGQSNKEVVATTVEVKKGDAKEAEVKVVPQTKCPVMGGDINKKLYVDYNGKRIYVCCGGCIGAINEKPTKYIKKLEDEGITLDKTPVSEKDKAGKRKK